MSTVGEYPGAFARGRAHIKSSRSAPGPVVLPSMLRVRRRVPRSSLRRFAPSLGCGPGSAVARRARLVVCGSLTAPTARSGYATATVDYASTINRAQGATVDEAHLIIDDRTNAAQLYVGMTRGRHAKHVHSSPPAFDPDQPGPASAIEPWTPEAAVAATAERQGGEVSALARRSELQDLAAQGRPHHRGPEPDTNVPNDGTADADRERVAAAVRRLARLTRRPSEGLGR